MRLKANAGVRLILGCDFHMGEYGVLPPPLRNPHPRHLFAQEKLVWPALQVGQQLVGHDVASQHVGERFSEREPRSRRVSAPGAVLVFASHGWRNTRT